MAIDPRVQTFLTALRAGHARAAEHIVRRELEAGTDPTAIQVEVLAPAMRAVGELWARDELSVAEEHLATANVIGAARDPAESSRERVMLAALEEERHVLGLQMIADELPIILGGEGVPEGLRMRPAPRYVQSADHAVRAVEDALGASAPA